MKYIIKPLICEYCWSPAWYDHGLEIIIKDKIYKICCECLEGKIMLSKKAKNMTPC